MAAAAAAASFALVSAIIILVELGVTTKKVLLVVPPGITASLTKAVPLPPAAVKPSTAVGAEQVYNQSFNHFHNNKTS